MKKLLAVVLVVAMLLTLSTSAVMAARGDNPANDKEGGVGNANVAFLYLYEKDPTTWDIVWDGAWGKMKFNLYCNTFDFLFNGHGLAANIDYSLIYYADPWPGNNPGALLASGTSNNGGSIHLTGSYNFGYDLVNAKIWLVLSSDYNATTNSMIAWNPTEYLFEHAPINYHDCDAGGSGNN